MKFLATELSDAYLIELEPLHDSRGFFARTFCVEEFGRHGLETSFPQHSFSFSARKGTLRGMHYQRAPAGETKLVRCLQGAIFDVIIDIRPSSPTYGCWQHFELSSNSSNQLYIPQGFAHGFQTLTEDVVVNYLISTNYSADLASGIHFSDPSIGIKWPLPIAEISEKDAHLPYFKQLGR
jgi:dTDP-4-dehydrorhamnose 3,5-epimerase